MKRFSVLLLVAVVLAFGALSFSSLASDGKTAANDAAAQYQKYLDLQKEFIQKQVDAGIITADQGKYMVDRIELARQYAAQNPATVAAPGYGRGFGFGPRMMGFGPRAGYGAPGRFCGGACGVPYCPALQ